MAWWNCWPWATGSSSLLLDLSDLRHDDGTALALDNIEGITWGPTVNGKRTLVLVSDNNFGATQFTQVVALSVDVLPVPEPATWTLWLAGSGVLAARVRGGQRCQR